MHRPPNVREETLYKTNENCKYEPANGVGKKLVNKTKNCCDENNQYWKILRGKLSVK